MKQLFCLILGLSLLLAVGCSDRNASPTPSSSSQESSASSVAESTPPPTPPSSSEASEPEEEADAAMPILTDAELEILGEGLEVFISQIGGTNLKDATQITTDVALPAILAEIDRTRNLAGYLFTKNDQKQELIPANIVSETASRMFGISAFSAPDLAITDNGASFYPYTAATPAALAHTVTVAGAPDDAIAYTVTFNETGSSYLFTCKVVRVNSIPYLRLLSIARAD